MPKTSELAPHVDLAESKSFSQTIMEAVDSAKTAVISPIVDLASTKESGSTTKAGSSSDEGLESTPKDTSFNKLLGKRTSKFFTIKKKKMTDEEMLDSSISPLSAREESKKKRNFWSKVCATCKHVTLSS